MNLVVVRVVALLALLLGPVSAGICSDVVVGRAHYNLEALENKFVIIIPTFLSLPLSMHIKSRNVMCVMDGADVKMAEAHCCLSYTRLPLSSGFLRLLIRRITSSTKSSSQFAVT